MRSRLIAAAAAVLLAVVGTLVLISYMRSAGDRAVNGAPVASVDVLVASGQIPVGTPGSALSALVATKSLPVVAVLANGVTDLKQLAGKVALVALQPGEQLLSSKFGPPSTTSAALTVPPGFQQVTILLPPERALGGHLKAGDTVGIFISMASPALTHLTLQKVLVTAVEASVAPAQVSVSTTPPTQSPVATATGTTAPPASTSSSAVAPVTDPTAGVLVTLAASAGDAEKIVFGVEHGTIWLSNEPANANGAGTQIVDGTKVYK